MAIANKFLSPAALAVTIITSVTIFADKEKRKKVIELITNKSFIINLIFIIGFVYYGLSIKNDGKEETKRLRSAIRTAILGMIIAFMAFVDLTLAPFWILFTAAYYFGIDG